MKIATLIPTFHRSKKLEAFIKHHDLCSSQSKLYFIVTPDDKKTKQVLRRLKQTFFVKEGEYVTAINYGIAKTTEDFVLCAADDVLFTKDWDLQLLALTKDPTKDIFGGIDSWKISQTQCHISHPLIRRTYAAKNSYYWEYIHYMCDIEYVQRGLQQNKVKIVLKTLIEHPHPYNPVNPQGTKDTTYTRSAKNLKHDLDLYKKRCGEFEVFDSDLLAGGYAVPTKLNPIYNKTLLSIVVPSFNDIDFLIDCLDSVVRNTFYRYEIIIINDHSDCIQSSKKTPWESINTKKLLNSFVTDDESCVVRVVHNTKQQWVNYNWNLGAQMAKGNYVAIINSDIVVSPDWDKFLVSALENPLKKSTIACPYQHDPRNKEPYSLDLYFRTYMPNMIRGACFMFRKSDVAKLFPIPSEIKHWCGDNVLADRAEKFNGVVFAKKSIIYHHLTQSGQKLPKTKYTNRTYKDILLYEYWSGKNMDHLKSRFPQFTESSLLPVGEGFLRP